MNMIVKACISVFPQLALLYSPQWLEKNINVCLQMTALFMAANPDLVKETPETATVRRAASDMIMPAANEAEAARAKARLAAYEEAKKKPKYFDEKKFEDVIATQSAEA